MISFFLYLFCLSLFICATVDVADAQVVSWATYKYTNQLWTYVGIPGMGTEVLAFKNGHTDANPTIYLSANFGASWVTYPYQSALVPTYAAFSHDGTVVVAVSYFGDGWISLSMNRGRFYLAFNTGYYFQGVACSYSGVIMAAVGTKQYILMSTDTGTTWYPKTKSPKTNYWVDIAMSSDASLIVALHNNVPNGGYLYSSTDIGATWTRQGSTPYSWQCVAMTATNSYSGNYLIAAAVTLGEYI